MATSPVYIWKLLKLFKWNIVFKIRWPHHQSIFGWEQTKTRWTLPSKFSAFSKTQNDFKIYMFIVIILIISLIIVFGHRWLTYSTLPAMVTLALTLIGYRLLKVTIYTILESQVPLLYWMNFYCVCHRNTVGVLIVVIYNMHIVFMSHVSWTFRTHVT